MSDENDSGFLGELTLILLGIILGVIIIPILLAMCIAWVIGAGGMLFFGIVIAISFVIWCILGLLWFI